MRTTPLKIGGRLDRYVAWLFIKSYLAAFFLVVGIFLIIDMATELEDYLKPDENGVSPPALDVVRFYGYTLPFLYLEMSPFVTLVAGLFTATKLVRHNEVVAALGAGIGLRRLFLPVFLGAVVLALGMFALREWATGEFGARKDALEDQLVERREVPVYEFFSIRDRERRSIRIDEYRPVTENDGRPEITLLVSHFPTAEGTCSIRAEKAWPLPPFEEGRWQLEGGRKIVTGDEQVPSSIKTLDDLRFTPADVELYWKGLKSPLNLSFSESLRLLERDPERAQYRTLFHYHLTFPLAGLVLLAVGLPFVLGQERGRVVERVAIGLFVCVAYFGMDFVTRTLGLQGHLGPIHAAWLPVVTFGCLGVVLMSSMRS